MIKKIWLGNTKISISYVFPSETCAGSLASGCFSLRKRVPASALWLADSAVLMSEAERRSHFCCPKLRFERPGACILAPWGTIVVPNRGTLGDRESSRQNMWGSGFELLSISGQFGNPILIFL